MEVILKKLSYYFSVFVFLLQSCAGVERRAEVQIENQTEHNSEVLIASWNLNVFGKTKAGRADTLSLMAKVISRFDFVGVQEIKDKSGEAFPKLLKALREINPNYDVLLSRRVGVGGATEQFAFLFRNNVFETVDVGGIADLGDGLFTRMPHFARFKVRGSSFDFVVVNVHIKPTSAFSEIENLPKVVGLMNRLYPGENNVLILGDLNSDCSYFSEGYETALRSTLFVWATPDDEDTTLADNRCTYDRIILSKATGQYYRGINGKVDFKSEYSLTYEEAKKVSDHFPLYIQLNSKPAK